MKEQIYYVSKASGNSVSIKCKGCETVATFHIDLLFDTMKDLTDICKKEGCKAVFIVKG